MGILAEIFDKPIVTENTLGDTLLINPGSENQQRVHATESAHSAEPRSFWQAIDSVAGWENFP